MEYLTSIHDSLHEINEEGIQYIDLFDYPELFFGNVNNNSRLDFLKFSKDIQIEMEDYGSNIVKEMNQYKYSSTGNRLRFETDSNRIIFKIELKRKYGYSKINNNNSFGFDVYNVDGEEYIHQEVFSPENEHNIFAKEIEVPENGKLCVFLPNFNTIRSFYLGICDGSSIKRFEYPNKKQLPVLFYGNAVTQGSSASRSGNTFPNILSRKLNRDMINISCSSCCKATDKTVQLLGKINCHAIVIDYTQNAYNTEIFKRTHEHFYKSIREFHPDKQIILMTSENFNFWKSYYDFDEIVENTYFNAKIKGDNVELIKQRELFDENEYDFVSVDNSNYNDYGMYTVANKLYEIIEK
jgi:hypothetical protein